MKLFMALEVMKRLDIAQESKALSDAELTLRRGLKRRVVGISVVERARKKQASRITNLKEGDANTKFFHQKVNARCRKNNIQRWQHQGGWVTTHEDKASIIQDYFAVVMGPPQPQVRDFNWEVLNTQHYDLEALAASFTRDEILKAVSLTPSGKTPGPDRFPANFFKSCWEIISGDLVTALNTFHDLRCLNFDLLNTANIVLLPKKEGAEKLETIGRSASFIASRSYWQRSWH